MKGFFTKFVLVLLCVVLLVALGGLLLLDRQNQQAEQQRLNDLMSTETEKEEKDSSAEAAQAEQQPEEEPKTEEVPEEPAETSPEGVACWGDELLSTEEAATYSYKVVLQNLLTENGYNLTVADKTLNGASTLSIMKMAGIPQTDLDAYVARHLEMAGGAELPIEETNMRDLTEEQMARPDIDYIPVIFMGYYGGWNHDTSELIEQEQKVLDTFGANKDKFIIVGIVPADGSVGLDTYDGAMKEAWGEHYISTAEVTTQPSASYDGQAEIANAIYQKLIELGYITK